MQVQVLVQGNMVGIGRMPQQGQVCATGPGDVAQRREVSDLRGTGQKKGSFRPTRGCSNWSTSSPYFG